MLDIEKSYRERKRRNIHEVVPAIMFNCIIRCLPGFFINKNDADRMTRSSRAVLYIAMACAAAGEPRDKSKR